MIYKNVLPVSSASALLAILLSGSSSVSAADECIGTPTKPSVSVSGMICKIPSAVEGRISVLDGKNEIYNGSFTAPSVLVGGKSEKDTDGAWQPIVGTESSIVINGDLHLDMKQASSGLASIVGGTATVNGNVSATMIEKAYDAVSSSGGDIYIKGKLDVTYNNPTPPQGYGLLRLNNYNINGDTKSLIVDGVVNLVDNGGFRGNAIQILGGQGEFRDNVTIVQNNTDGLTPSISNAIVSGSGYHKNLSNLINLVRFHKNLDIQTNSDVGLDMFSGRIEVGNDLRITMKHHEDTIGNAVRMQGGGVNVEGKAIIHTFGDAKDNQRSGYGLYLSSLRYASNYYFSAGKKLVEKQNTAQIYLGKGSSITTEGLSADGIYIDEGSVSKLELTNEGSITALKANAIDIAALGNIGGYTVLNTGTLSATEVSELAYKTGFAYRGNPNDETFISRSGKIVGKVVMGKGNDVVTLEGNDLLGLTELNGSASSLDYLGTGTPSSVTVTPWSMYLESRIADTAVLNAAETDTLNLNQDLVGYTKNSFSTNKGTNILNWNRINLGKDKAAKLTLTGDLMPKDRATEKQLNIAENATLALGEASEVRSEVNVGYHIENAGTIDLTAIRSAPGIRLVVENYQGRNGVLQVKSNWNNPDVQANDQLVIKGTASGQTVVKVLNGVIGGNVIRDNIEKNGGWSNPVVVVEGGDSGNEVFTGTANTSSASQAQLTRKEENGVAKYTWTLKAGDQYIYAHPVSGYVLQPYINSQMGLAQLGQLHQRVGEQYKNGLENKQVWGRLSLNNEDLQGANRFGAKVRSGFVQFGKDVIFKQNADQSHRHIGLTATYGWANSSFYDKYNAKNGEITADKYTGKSKTDMFSVGGYHTDYAANGWYIDRVAQISWLRNKYKSEQDARQTGWGFGASVETGKPYPLQRNPNWAIEPQAQLSYQWFKLGSVNDGERYVQGKNQHNLTARLGARLTWNKSEKDNQAQAYFGTHFIQTLIGRTSKVKIGQDRVQENMGGLVVAFDLGGQYPITKNLSLYGDVRYQISLDKHRNSVYRDSHLAREGYNGRVGVRYTW